MSSPITDISPDTLALVDRLKEVPIGGTVTWQELSAALGSPAQGRRHIVDSAIRIALREHGAVFVSVRSEGYNRLPPDEAHKLGAHARGSIQRKSRRARKAIARAIDGVNGLAPDAARKSYREMSVLGLVEHAVKDGRQEAVAVEDKPLPVAKVAAQFLAALQS